MAVSIRLRRMGRRKRPLYAVVVSDSRNPRDGRFLEDLGRYEPIQAPAVVSLKAERILYWLQVGAKPTETVRSLLSKEGIMLNLHLIRKGKSAEEIEQALAAFRAAKQGTASTEVTKGDRRKQALQAELQAAKAREAEEAKRRAEAEERVRREAEEAQRKLAEERLAAQQAALAEQEAANAAQAEEEA